MNFSYFGLSATQEHLYKHFAVSGDQVHETRFVISLAGLLDSDHLFASLRDLIARHEGLRTKFILHNGQVLQGVCNDDIYLNPEIIDVDNTGLISNYETDGHIDLDDFPLFKVNLYRRNDTQHFLVFRCHEILLDRESCSIILYDLTCLYGGLGLKATDLQYVDYSIQQSDMLKSDAGQFTRNYWQAALSHLGRSEFPFDSKVECGSLDRKSLTFLVNKSDIDLTICDAETEYLYFFLAVYFIFIHKNSTDTDIIVSLYSPERGIDFSDVVGNFSNIVPVRRQISPSVRFKEFYDEIKIAVHRATTEFGFPFFEAIKSLTDGEVANLLTFGFRYFNNPMKFRAAEVEFFMTGEPPNSGEGLVLNVRELDHSFEVTIDFDGKQCLPGTVHRYGSQIQQILNQVRDVSVNIEEIDILTPEDRRKIITEFNNTDEAFPLDKTFIDLFEEQVKTSSDSIAAVDKNTELTYAELNRRANQVARLLVAKGIQPEELVPILCERSVEMLIGIIGVFKAGAAYIPIDLEFPHKRVISILNDAQSRIVLSTHASLAGKELYFAEVCSETMVRDLIVLDTEVNSLTREMFYKSFLAMICGKRNAHHPYKGRRVAGPNQLLQGSDWPIGFELDLKAKVALLREYLSHHIIGSNCVGVWLDGRQNILMATLALKDMGTELITINSALSRKDKVKVIRESNIDAILTEGKFLDEVDSLLWEIDTLHTYMLIDKSDTDTADKDSIVKDIFNFETEKSIEELNDFGWVSSYDGKPFSREVMQQYIDNFCDKLSPFLSKNTKVLEIGCGHGLVLSHIAPRIGYYCATDLSDKVIDRHRKRFAEAGLTNVDFMALSAKEIAKIDKKDFFDVIVSSSVIHFFPNTIYLEEVIKNAIELLANKGVIYIDQILDLSKKESMVQSNINFNLTHDVRTAKVHWDDDLFLDKRFFYDLQVKYPEIISLEFSEQNGAVSSELKEFRYDLIIKVNKEVKTRNSKRAFFKNRLHELRLNQAEPAIDHQKHKSSELEKLIQVFGQIIDQGTLSKYETENLNTKPAPSNLSFVIYTSGSTGNPKGTMNEHIGMLNHCFIMIKNLSIDRQSIIAQTAPHCFDISVWQFLTALIVGGKTVIYENEKVFNTAQLLEKLSDNAVTILQVVPSYLSLVIDIIKFNRWTDLLRNVRYLIVCGEAVSPELVRAWLEISPNTPIINAYGPAEASDDISLYKIHAYREMSTVPIGKPAENCRIYVVDEHMRLLPIGVKGEICVSGIGVGRGYVNNPERTAASFLNDPFADVQPRRLYKTGDLGRFLPDGNLEFHGRKDYQVKIRGQRVELGEIESVLLSNVNVGQAAVIDLVDLDGNRYLCGYVSSKDHVKLDPDELMRFLKNELPGYMVPSYLIPMKKLPFTSNGKINRKALPPPESRQQTDTFAYPANEKEGKMLAIWKEILGLDRISVDSSFFEIGGHSLRAMKLVALVHRDFNRRITLKDVFLNTTIRSLTSVLSRKTVDSFQEIPKAPVQECYDVTPSQEDMWLLEQFREGDKYFSSFYSYKGELNLEALEKSYQLMIDRHEILRTIFVQVDGRIKQKVVNELKWNKCFIYSDFRNVKDAIDSAANFVKSTGELPFVLSEGPLVRLVIAQVKDDEFLIAFNMHHIIKDGWSTEIFSDELMLVYNCFIQSKPSPLAPLKIQFKDYACWYNEMLQNDGLKESKAFWSSKFADTIPKLNLSDDILRAKTYIGKMHSFLIDEARTKDIVSIGSHQDNSLFGTLLSCLYVLLYRFTGQNDIVIGTPVAGREHPDLTNQIGLYLNVLPIRNKVTEAMTFAQLLGLVRQSCLDSFTHQLYPFNYMVRDLGIKYSSSRNPLFDVGFVLQEQTHLRREGDVRADISSLSMTAYGTVLDGMVNDLWFSIANNGNRVLMVSMHYNQNCFDEETIERLGDALLKIIGAVGKNAQILLGDIELTEKTGNSQTESVSIDLVF